VSRHRFPIDNHANRAPTNRDAPTVFRKRGKSGRAREIGQKIREGINISEMRASFPAGSISSEGSKSTERKSTD
jgi:hypothetical protein